jgi:hypothetical protein
MKLTGNFAEQLHIEGPVQIGEDALRNINKA